MKVAPSGVQLPPRGSYGFTATGGTGSYVWTLDGTGTLEGGFYRAGVGGGATLRATDTLGNVGTATVAIGPSVAGTVQGLTLAVLLAVGTSASMALHRPSVSVVVIAIAAIVARAAWQATRTVAVLDRAVARVTTAAGMLPLPLHPALAPRVSGSAETTLSRG